MLVTARRFGASARRPRIANAAGGLLCALLCAAAVAAAAPLGCGDTPPLRRLLQDTPAAGSNMTIETVEVDVVSQECVMLQNAHYTVDPALGVLELEQPQNNLKDSARACCASCHDRAGCNIFQWCPEVTGCFLGAVAFPYQGCQLIDLSGFLNTSINTGQIKQEGPDVKFTSGSPLFFSVPKLSNYDVEIGRNFGGRFNYSCPSSAFNGTCVLFGTAQELGAACNADPGCLAFSFYPKGSPMLPDSPFGVLKGGQGIRITSADTELNPNAAIYIKLEPYDSAAAGSSGDTGESSNTVVIAAVVGSVVGTAAVAAVLLAFVYRRYRRLKASVADDRKVAGGAGQPGLSGSPQEPGAGLEDDMGSGSGSGSSGPLPELSSGGGASPVAADGGGAASEAESSFSGSFAAKQGGGREGFAAEAEAMGPPHGEHGWVSDSGSARYSPFLVVSSHPAGAAGSNPPAVSDVEASRSNSAGSADMGGAVWEVQQVQPSWQQQVQLQQFQQAWQHSVQQQQQQHLPEVQVEVRPAAQPDLFEELERQLQPRAQQQQQQQWQQPQQQQQQWQQPQRWQQQQVSAEPLSVVVEVARSVEPAGGARGDPPPSLQQAGTARELLEVFARMYSQRPAVDYAVVAAMLDQEADPQEVHAAEMADEEQLRRLDAAAVQARATSRAPSAPASGSSSAASASADAQVAAAHAATAAAAAAAWHQQQATAQQHAAAPAQGSVLGPAATPGSAQLEQEQSLLPGMMSPVNSLLPAPSDWALQPEEIEICKRPDGSYWQLGTGAFGTCYKGLYHGQQLVAVKVLHRVEERRRGEEFEREVALLKDLRDRNIVQFIGACLDGPTPMLVTEFMEFGDLWRALPLKNPAGHRIFAWHKRGRRVLFDVAKGLHSLHQRRIVHLDLKSANILLSRHGTAKICDIGMARVLGNKEYLSMLSGMGTFAWSAPEVLSGKRCTEKVDLYSFGVVIWEVCTGDVPVRGEMRPLAAPGDCPQEMVDLHERCISEHPEERPTAAELLQVLASLL